jgi:hypothetical protein
MASIRAGSVALCVAIVSTIGSEIPLDAQVGVGTWVRQSESKVPGMITMTVEMCLRK